MRSPTASPRPRPGRRKAQPGQQIRHPPQRGLALGLGHRAELEHEAVAGADQPLEFAIAEKPGPKLVPELPQDLRHGVEIQNHALATIAASVPSVAAASGLRWVEASFQLVVQPGRLPPPSSSGTLEATTAVRPGSWR